MNTNKLNQVISESIKMVIHEKNYMNNSGVGDLFNNIDKAQKHIKAAMNCFKKAGLYDNMRGNSDSYYAEIMGNLSKANSMLERYYWETFEGDEYGVYDGKTPDDFKVKQGMKNRI